MRQDYDAHFDGTFISYALQNVLVIKETGIVLTMIYRQWKKEKLR